MAKRSDFAQKLLDDLRLRKEKMGLGASGQTGQYSAQSPSNANANGTSRWAFRGSGEANTGKSSNKSIPNTGVTRIWLGARHHRTPFEGTSQDIVPGGRTREQSVDVSMALALALSNTGKLQNIELFSNATVGKKQILQHRSLNLREMDNNHAFLSPLQIGEISKGVHQLNTILKASSNGVIFSRDSIDIGRELLKGAIDLEESLRMLVTLQDASDFMEASKGKQIKLLKGKEDETSSEEAQKRRLMKPRFSFDRPSKHSHNHVKDGSNSHSNKNSNGGNCFNSTNVKRMDPKGELVSEKVRIPNVVAKLMGLEELPPTPPEVKKIEIQNVPEPKHITGINKKEANKMAHLVPKEKRQNKGTQEKGIDETLVMKSLEAVHSKVKKNIKDLNNSEHTGPVSSQGLHFSISKQRDTKMHHITELKVPKKEKVEPEEKASLRLQISKAKVDNTFIKHENAQTNMDVVPKQQRNALDLNLQVIKQPQSAISRLKTKQNVHKNQEKIEHNTGDKLQPVKAKNKEVKLKNAEISLRGNKTQKGTFSMSNTTKSMSFFKEQSKVYQKHNHKEKEELRNRNNAYQLKAADKNDNEKIMPRILAPAISQPIKDPSAKKVDITKLITGRNKNSRILIDGNTKGKAVEAKDQNLKKRASFLHELEQRWKERTGKSEAVGSHGMNSESHSQQKSVTTNHLCSPGDTAIPVMINQIITAESNVEAKQEEANKPMQINKTEIATSATMRPLQTSIKADLELIPMLLENKSEGPAHRRKLSNRNMSDMDGQALLTKDEYILKQILINSQQFLNTAQALFKINIPIDVLWASENTHHKEHCKFVLDCGYEIMRRKGKREEGLFFKYQTFAPVNVRCLDKLIKELNKDLKSLEWPSKTDSADYDTAECLHKMIERDVQNRNPDLNCMWDIGWNSMDFASIEKEEIIKEVEKCVFNGLINDLARDLMSVSTNI